MKEIYSVFGNKMKTIPVFHPRVNRSEKYNGVIKLILRKLVVNEPREWHRYLDPLLFAIRTVPNVSGFSSFELLFGREARTHMTFLKELWSGTDIKSEDKIVYQHVIDLKNRIKTTSDFARKELNKIQQNNFKRCNEKAKLRIFNPGDKVWVMNTRTVAKLDLCWCGPAEVIRRVGRISYVVRFKDMSEKLYHVNLLKLYVDREKLLHGKKRKISLWIL